jgi:hypothetical protein
MFKWTFLILIAFLFLRNSYGDSEHSKRGIINKKVTMSLNNILKLNLSSF